MRVRVYVCIYYPSAYLSTPSSMCLCGCARNETDDGWMVRCQCQNKIWFHSFSVFKSKIEFQIKWDTSFDIQSIDFHIVCIIHFYISGRWMYRVVLVPVISPRWSIELRETGCLWPVGMRGKTSRSSCSLSLLNSIAIIHLVLPTRWHSSS